MTRKPQEPAGTSGSPSRIPGVYEALEAALVAAEVGAEDAATVALARRYAILIDRQVTDLVDTAVGRDFLRVLTALGLTPEARKAVAKGVNLHVVPNRLDALIADRRKA